MIKLLIIDRDGTCVHNSSDPASPFYYILSPAHLVLKPKVREAFALLSVLRAVRGLKVVLATRQRCISKGLITRPEVDGINTYLGNMIGFSFDSIYVEETAETKAHLFAAILSDFNVSPSDTYLIDDSYAELNAAWSLGIQPRPTSADLTADLYGHVCRLFSLT